jgi:hypothetical protein
MCGIGNTSVTDAVNLDRIWLVLYVGNCITELEVLTSLAYHEGAHWRFLNVQEFVGKSVFVLERKC